MKKIKFLRIIFYLPLSIIFCGCVSLEKKDSGIVAEKLDRIDPGNSYQQLLSIYGPGDEDVEPFTGKHFNVVSYKNNGEFSREDFYLDSNKKNIIIKTQNLQPSDVTIYMKSKFPDGKFIVYYPCHAFGDERIFIDTKHNVQLHTNIQKVHTVSYTTSEYMAEFINDLYKNCGSIQPRR